VVEVADNELVVAFAGEGVIFHHSNSFLPYEGFDNVDHPLGGDDGVEIEILRMKYDFFNPFVNKFVTV